MNMFNKKGQAAMEFLMTYGWAILAAVIVVGVLWYMIGNPANLAGNNFQVSAPLVATGMNVSTGGDITIGVRNGAGSSITINTINADSCTAATPASSIAVGDDAFFTLSCTYTSGDRINSDVTISYTESGSSMVQSATGSITGRVP